MAIQYLVPGGSYINEGTSQLEYLVPGGSYINETSASTGILYTQLERTELRGVERGILTGVR